MQQRILPFIYLGPSQCHLPILPVQVLPVTKIVHTSVQHQRACKVESSLCRTQPILHFLRAVSPDLPNFAKIFGRKPFLAVVGATAAAPPPVAGSCGAEAACGGGCVAPTIIPRPRLDAPCAKLLGPCGLATSSSVDSRMELLPTSPLPAQSTMTVLPLRTNVPCAPPATGLFALGAGPALPITRPRGGATIITAEARRCVMCAPCGGGG
mmetsp:Transcript_21337/g.46615  ORF Transcript_21337/g.46615 Transcript_21337/m.46615 type:complete len:210 (+) Transcript_21337:1447-2076(+)